MKEIEEIAGDAPKETREKISSAMERADWEYLAEELPHATSQSQDGVKRVASIVRAMKEFSHPGSKEKQLLSINHIIQTTTTVARNEWKYVAEMTTDLAPDLPNIPLLGNEMGQVFLNMIINAAHAIAKKIGHTPHGEKGKITISTRQIDNMMEIRISDTGNGMDEEVGKRIYEPFFTTKSIGKGTGQGLAIAYDIVVNKHGGVLECESVKENGTCFLLHLPMDENKE